MTFEQPTTLTPAEEAEFQASEVLFKKHLGNMPKRDAFPVGPGGDKAFEDASDSYIKDVFEKPKTVSGVLEEDELNLATKRADARKARHAKIETDTRTTEAKFSEAVTRIDAGYFADMPEEKIKAFIRNATLAQVKAVLASDHWQMDEKKEMLKIRWEKELKEFKEFDKDVNNYKSKMTLIWKAIGDGIMDFTIVHKDKRNQVVPTRTATDPRTGKVYAYDRNNQAYEMPENPWETRFEKTNLRNWMRNKMTKPEFEVAASIVPEMFTIPSLVQVIRWPMIFKEFRTDEAFPYEMRQGMTYLKDANLDCLIDEKDPNYIPEDSEQTRGEAFIKAREAAMAAPEEDRDKVFRATYDKYTPRDAIRNMIAVEWNKGRALGEVPRGRYRGKIVYHRLLDRAMGKKMGGNDAHEIMGEKEGFVINLMRDYLAEERGEGYVTDANRELMQYLFCDPRSTDIPRNISFLSPEFLQLYNRLQKEGSETGVLVFPSDRYRGIKTRAKFGTKSSKENRRRDEEEN